MDYKASPHLIKVFDFGILHLELNTAIYILVLVLIVMFFMNKLLFQPVLRTLDQRTDLRSSLQDAAVRHQAEIARLTQDYEASLDRVRQDVARLRQESYRQSQQAVDAILDQARQEAEAEFQDAMADLNHQVSQAKDTLGGTSQQLAQQVTSRILGA